MRHLTAALFLNLAERLRKREILIHLSSDGSEMLRYVESYQETFNVSKWREPWMTNRKPKEHLLLLSFLYCSCILALGPMINNSEENWDAIFLLPGIFTFFMACYLCNFSKIKLLTLRQVSKMVHDKVNEIYWSIQSGRSSPWGFKYKKLLLF